nr:PREDICTED: uncharacterized protein LOC104150330 [Struthio camelus australis]
MYAGKLRAKGLFSRALESAGRTNASCSIQAEEGLVSRKEKAVVQWRREKRVRTQLHEESCWFRMAQPCKGRNRNVEASCHNRGLFSAMRKEAMIACCFLGSFPRPGAVRLIVNLLLVCILPAQRFALQVLGSTARQMKAHKTVPLVLLVLFSFLFGVYHVGLLEEGSLWRTTAASRAYIVSYFNPVCQQDVQKLIDEALEKLEYNQVGMPDYARKSSGATVMHSKTSGSLRNTRGRLFWAGLPLLHSMKSPEVILEPENHAGNCWSFPGSQGHVVIKLPRAIFPQAVTLEHISVRVSPGENISSAPRDFAVYGMKAESEEQGTFLGEFTYVAAEHPFQTFQLQNERSDFIQYVKLKVLSNWGHPEYTCVYRFRVHVNPVELVREKLGVRIHEALPPRTCRSKHPGPMEEAIRKHRCEWVRAGQSWRDGTTRPPPPPAAIYAYIERFAQARLGQSAVCDSHAAGRREGPCHYEEVLFQNISAVVVVVVVVVRPFIIYLQV